MPEKSIFEQKEMPKKTLSIKISKDIYDQLEDIKIRLHNEDDLNFPTAKIIEEALSKAIKKGNKELDTLEKTTTVNE